MTSRISLPAHPSLALARQPPILCAVEHGRDVLGDEYQASTREFLITNGVGGYASASILGTLTRSYHGLLIAALKPPLDRTLMLSAIDDAALYLGRAYVLAPHPFEHADPAILLPSSPSQQPQRIESLLSTAGTPTNPKDPPVSPTLTSKSTNRSSSHMIAAPAAVHGAPPTSPLMYRVPRPGAPTNHSTLGQRPLASPAVLRAISTRKGLGTNVPPDPVVVGPDCITTASSLESFRLEGTMPVFTYALADALLEKRIWMKRAENAVFIRYTLLRASRPVSLSLDAMVNHRNHHSRTLKSRPGFSHSTCCPAERTVVIEFQSTAPAAFDHERPTRLVIRSTMGRAEIANAWIHGGILHRERERCLPCVDDHLHAASFMVDLVPGSNVTIVAAAYEGKGHPGDHLPSFVQNMNIDQEFADFRLRELHLLDLFRVSREQHLRRRAEIAEKRRRRLSLKSQSLLVKPCVNSEEDRVPGEVLRPFIESAVAQLVLAADQFIIERGLGKSVIAGYHWFADWSRDTMISLPGLTICTGRLDVTRAVLLTFAAYVSGGMLPNRFPDDGREPGDDEYNTADGTLWYFESIRAYHAATNDRDLLAELFPVLEAIVHHHCEGTRFGIRMDPDDGLLYAGVEGVALTWMDAKTGEHVFTPRIGKPVELGALWFNALSVMKTFASELGMESKCQHYSNMAYQTEKGFRQRFWNPRKDFCFDVVDAPEIGNDDSLRPNQIIAASLQWSPLSPEQRLKVVEVCAQALITSHGLRTLSPDDDQYRGTYEGNLYDRDAAYHQGTVWPWLLGPFVMAHLRVYSDRRAARAFLVPLLSTISSMGQGTLAEIFDGDAPFRPRGCIAQAWSVAEFLRAWVETEPDLEDVPVP